MRSLLITDRKHNKKHEDGLKFPKSTGPLLKMVLVFSMKFKIILIFTAVVLLVFPFTYKWWPSGDVQDFAIIWFKSEELSELISYAETTNFERIMWCRGNHPSSFRKNGIALTQSEAKNDNEVIDFISFASEVDIPCFWAHLNGNKWFVQASHGGGRGSEDGIATMTQISRYYYFSKTIEELGCVSKRVQTSSLETCKRSLFGNWYMFEERMTYPFEDV
jgi:hypothetical protein